MPGAELHIYLFCLYLDAETWEKHFLQRFSTDLWPLITGGQPWPRVPLVALNLPSSIFVVALVPS